jgi:hypothetical protein
MKKRTVAAILAFLFASASAALAGRVSLPALWAYEDETFVCMVSNITDQPVDFVITFYNQQGLPAMDVPQTAPPRGTQGSRLVLRSNGFLYCEVEVPGQSDPLQHVHISFGVFDNSGVYTAVLGRP